MHWRRKPGTDPADPHGVADLLARACETVSATAVEGTRFLLTTEEMLRVSRDIEQAAMIDPSVPLFVGVQHGHRLDPQVDVYTTLIAAGVDVLGFGVDGGSVIDGVQWTIVEADPYDLAAQWFLVRGGEDPHALVGFELSSSPGGPRRWEGFETRDRMLVEGIVGYLSDLAGHEGGSRERADAGRSRHHD